MMTLQKLLRQSVLLTLCLFPLTGCQMRIVEIDSACTAFNRITFDRLKDTDDTIRAVKSYNAGRDAICGKGK